MFFDALREEAKVTRDDARSLARGLPLYETAADEPFRAELSGAASLGGSVEYSYE